MSINGFCSAGLLGHRCVPKQPVCGCVDGGSQSCFSCRRDRRTNPAEHQSRSPSSNAALCTALHWLHCTAYIAVTHYLCRSTATKLCPVEPGTLLLPLAISTPSLAPLIIASTSRLNDLNLRAGPSRLFLLRTAVFSRARPPAEANSIGNPCKPPFLPGLSGQLLHSSCASFPSVVSPSLAPPPHY